MSVNVGQSGIYGQTGTGGTYAEFWARFAAYVIDTSILIFVALVISIGSSYTSEIGMLIGNIVFIVINLLYWPVMESSKKRATLGKMVVGLQVTDLNGNRQTFLRALLRNLAKIISAIPLGIGFILAAFTRRKQALHDIITKSLVVRTEESRLPKSLAKAAGSFVLAVGSAGAYFYFVLGADMQDTMPVAVMSQPAPAPAMPQPVSAPVMAQPASAPAITPKPKAATAKPKSLKPLSSAKKTTPKKPAKEVVKKPVNKTVAVKKKKPVVKQKVATQVVEVLPDPRPIVSFAPVTETRVITPKYNDIMTAVLRSDLEATKQLIDLGWWVDKPGPDGFTPLIAAIMNEDINMVKLLLENGAVPTSKALDLARSKKNAEAATLLEQRGAH